MKKELFKLRHAALVGALALAMGAPPAFADEAPLDVPAVQPAPEVDAPAVDVPVTVVDPAPVDEPVAVDDPAPVDEPVAIDEPTVVDEPVAIDDPAVVDEPVAIDDPAVSEPRVIDEPLPDDAVTLGGPVDDCGMICWNSAEMPPGAVQKGGEEIDPQILQFGAPEPTVNVTAELSGAVGVAEQLGAADAELGDGATVDPLAQATPAAVVTTASAGPVNVIRDGHLR